MELNQDLLKHNNKSQAIGLLLLSVGYMLFIISSFQYSNESWFYYLIGGRVLILLLTLTCFFLSLLGRSPDWLSDTYIYTLALCIQAFHGVLESPYKTDFYSYTGILYIIAALSVRTSFLEWLKKIFVIQIFFLLLPLFFKDGSFFSSVGVFVDSFSLPVAGLILGTIVAWINSQKFQILLENILLEKNISEERKKLIDIEERRSFLFKTELEKAQVKLKKLIHAEAVLQISQQVAHDIRSPLSALSMIMGTLKDLPEEKRILIRNATQRINDIANGLLQKGKAASENRGQTEIIQDPTLTKSIEFIPALVDILVSEKRMQYREHIGLEIQTELKNSFGAFARINSIELKRVISNLINNSIEAFKNHTGTVTVGVQKITVAGNTKVEIFIKDNGKGIPAHIIGQLGQMGVSHGKASSEESGSGLGLYHAKLTAESFGGSLEIESAEGSGTSIRMRLPLAEAPAWFANRIDLTGKKFLVSLDDDTSIHQIWEGRLQDLANDLAINNLEHIKFQSGEAFEKYVYANLDQMKETLFLIDYELLNQAKTGLDLIAELGIEKYCILVTSRYEENEIQSWAARLKLQILPKTLAGFVPFARDIVDAVVSVKIKYDAILLDDDSLMHMTWKLAAKDKSKLILCFQSREELMAKLSEVDPSCIFYIDENLSNGVKGEQVTKELFELGYKNLFLATGYQADQFQHMTWVKGVVGKDPVF